IRPRCGCASLRPGARAGASAGRVCSLAMDGTPSRSNMKRFWLKIGRLALVLGLTLLALSGCTELFEDDPGRDPTVIPSPAAGGETARVTYVIDGDTIDVPIGTEIYRVRYVGVNTPERDEPCYNDATRANSVLVDDQ